MLSVTVINEWHESNKHENNQKFSFTNNLNMCITKLNKALWDQSLNDKKGLSSQIIILAKTVQ